MIIIFGEKAYGKVDRVPGVCYVITIFAHLNFIPLVPARSYIVVEGTEEGGQFRGKEIPVSLKSTVAGYVRVWCGAAAIIAGCIAGFGLKDAAGALKLNDLTVLGLVVTGIAGLLAIFVGGKFGAVMQVGVHIVSAILWYVFDDAVGQNVKAARGVEGPLVALVIANMALLLYGLTRFMDHANDARRRELLEALGVEMPPADSDEPQAKQDKWEDWDEHEDRRKSGQSS
jgi:hypothetical protein